MGGSILLIASSLLSGLWPFNQERQTITERYVIPAWHIDATRDRFTQEMRCRIYQGNDKKPVVSFFQSALVFRFAHKLNTTRANFQVDMGKIRPWTAIYPELLGSGARLPGRSLDNPSEGMVILPVSILVGAQVVTIRPTPNSRPQRFGIGGFSDAFKSGVAQGCNARTGFDL